MKPGERTAKLVHPLTHLHYGSDESGWETYTAIEMPYEENGEFWVQAKDASGEVWEMPLHNAMLGI